MQINDILLGVNIDHVATLRNARNTRYPDPVSAALIAEEGGADGITIHLREDRRHIRERDVFLLKEMLLTRMNLEMAVTEEMLAFAEKVKPDHVCFVPEKRQELTTEGGLEVAAQLDKIKAACDRLGDKGIQVSLFIDPEFKQIDAAYNCNAKAIEIHTGNYADAANPDVMVSELQRVSEAVEYAMSKGLIVNAGHGLNYQNIKPIAAIKAIQELNIGHGIIARAVFTGLKQAVIDMKQLMSEARR